MANNRGTMGFGKVKLEEKREAKMEFEYYIKESCLDPQTTNEILDGFAKRIYICQQDFENRVNAFCHDILATRTDQVHVGADCLDETIAQLKIVELDFDENCCVVEICITPPAA